MAVSLDILIQERYGAHLSPEDGNQETKPRYPKMGQKREHKFQHKGSLPIDVGYPRSKPKYSLEKNLKLPSLAKSNKFSMDGSSHEILNMR